MAAADMGDMGDEGGWGDDDLVLDEGTYSNDQFC